MAITSTRVSGAQLDRLVRAARLLRASVWDSHPPTEKRIARSQGAPDVGLCIAEGPAIELLGNFEMHGKAATAWFYGQQFGGVGSWTTTPTATIMNRYDDDPQARQNVLGLFTPAVAATLDAFPVLPRLVEWPDLTNPARFLKRWADARATMKATRDAAVAAAPRMHAARNRWEDAIVVGALLQVGLRASPIEFGVMGFDRASVEDCGEEARRQMEIEAASVIPFTDAALSRLTSAIILMKAPVLQKHLPRVQERLARVQALLAAAAALGEAAPKVSALHRARIVGQVLSYSDDPEARVRTVFRSGEPALEMARGHFADLRAILSVVQDPFADDEHATLRDRMIPFDSAKAPTTAFIDTLGVLCEVFALTSRRVVGELIGHAAYVEAVLKQQSK